ncbi:hypothetical protein BJ878DRAFT_531738 [Calycina marina]|uniref:Alpha/beta hydrolase fold-3 domain-containing protein n=1 Tax=Calycina marina TaxID=1763456 RepID=A0A9P7ZAR9_9HELO|nr:hypothetical protein BJ878DRAFT_531738 [Calycina marina]
MSSPSFDSAQPPCLLHASIASKLRPTYVNFYTSNLEKLQHVHLQPVEASRLSGFLILCGGRPEAAWTEGPGVVVLSPEDPFPAAVNDCWETIIWLYSNGTDLLNLDASKFAMGSSSTGGNLTAVMYHKVLFVKNVASFKSELLILPATDDTASWKSSEFVPALPAEKKCSGVTYGKKLIDAGAEVEVKIMAGMPHPLLAMDSALQQGRCHHVHG